MNNGARIPVPEFTSAAPTISPQRISPPSMTSPRFISNPSMAADSRSPSWRAPTSTLLTCGQFRTSFGLPANDPQIIVNGADPEFSARAKETEADLDVEWSGAVARNAAIKFVVSKSTSSSDGVYLSAQYIVSHNLAPVMSMSFSLCEAALGSSGNSFINSLWQQAAAQGITCLFRREIAGPRDAIPHPPPAPRKGAQSTVSALRPTVCVGGTEFNDTSHPSLYWCGPTLRARSHLQSVTFRRSHGMKQRRRLWATGGGMSIIYAKPSWQTGSGVPADGKRDVPDVSLTSAGHDGYLIYQSGGLYVVGGTSASAPSFAGAMALVVQNSAARQGNANTAFYSLATRQRAGGASVFHDITSGNNSVPGQTGFAATTGYDQATGLGSIDGLVLVSHWSDATATPHFTRPLLPVRSRLRRIEQ